MQRFPGWFLVPVVVAGLWGCGHHASGTTEAQALKARQNCTFQAGALAKDTLASDAPIGAQIPIDHIILIMQENRSFDHYFSKLTEDGVDVASPTVTNPDENGNPVQRFHMTQYCFADTEHGWPGTHEEIDNGKMDGYVLANNPDGERSMGYYDDTDLPFYYDLARTFTISDRHFSSVPGDTAPNREFYIAATSRGAVSEHVVPAATDAQGRTLPNMMALLDTAHVSWKFYSPVPATPELGSILVTDGDIVANDGANFDNLTAFFTDLQNGTLPSVSWVDEAFSDPTGSNEHPDADMQQGQRFIASVVNALFASPDWPKSALFITWDEPGGQYDHVPPPKACIPDDFKPFDKDDQGNPIQVQGDFDMYGPRVPLLLVSPYARRGHVSHHVTDHTSLLRFIEARFNLPAMTRRDANAEPPFDMFDFQHPDTSIPTLRPAVVDDPTKHGCN